MALYEIALPILQIELLSVFLESAEEFEQGSSLGIRQAANSFSQFVSGRRGLRGRANSAVQSGG